MTVLSQARAARVVAARADGTIALAQGEFRVSDDPDVVLCTLLGSCVAACIRDPVAGIGGMNHFMLPGTVGQTRAGDLERYGVHAMEMLINALLIRGADRRRLEMKLFGGAKTVHGLTDIGSQNADFARGFARLEGLHVVGQCLGGMRGRRIQFWPVSGRARRSFLAGDARAVPTVPPPVWASGSLELF